MPEFDPGKLRAANSAGAGFRASRGMDGQSRFCVGLQNDPAPGPLAKHGRYQTALEPASHSSSRVRAIRRSAPEHIHHPSRPP